MFSEEGGFPVEERYSAWQKKKVRAIIVNSRAKNATQRSICSALTIAKPYDRIEVTEGDYNEAITVTFPLEIVAAEGETARIVSRNSGITVTSGVEFYLEDLTVISKSPSRQDASVVVMSGSPVIYKCTLNSVLVGGFGKVHIEHSTISHSYSGYGLSVHDTGGGTIQNTRIHSHTGACASIDTRGELLMTECRLYNAFALQGDVLSISGSSSSYARDGSLSNVACSRVTISACEIYIDEAEPDTPGKAVVTSAPANACGTPCCAVIASSAAPTLVSNEFVEGHVGILLDRCGAALLSKNIIRNQARCGILAVVDEEYAYTRGLSCLCIKGDNVLDKCYIGIDVQSNCGHRGVSVVSSGSFTSSNNANGTARRLLSRDLPSAKHAHHWLLPLHDHFSDKSVTSSSSSPVKTPASPTRHEYRRKIDLSSRAPDEQEGSECRLTLLGEPLDVGAVRRRLRGLVNVTLNAHPTCLESSFGLMSIAWGSVMAGGLVTASPLRNLLAMSIGAVTENVEDKEEAKEAMLKLRGSQGVDIVNTKFSNCGMCAIRFGKQGYGLVDDCKFEDCGTHAIVVDSGAHPIITGCRFLHSCGAAILVGNFANPLIVGNEIATGVVDGIVVSTFGRGVIVGNMITNNIGAGVRVCAHSEPVLASNVIAQNRGGGVIVEEGSRPFIGFNRCAANMRANLTCATSSSAFVAYNYIAFCVDAGIAMESCCRGTIVRNDIVGNGDGIIVELDADPYVLDNSIQSSVRCGVVARNNSLGVFVRNHISESGAANVLLSEGSFSIFRCNIIEKGYQGGVVVSAEGGGLLEHNMIRDNSVANVTVVQLHTNPSFIRNSIYASASGCGVVCAHGSKGLFRANHIYENKECGVYVFNSANPKFVDNTISREAVGVMVSMSGKGSFESNTIDACYGIGVRTQSGGEPTFTNNDICGNRLCGLNVAPDGFGVFSLNKLHENDVGVQLGSTAPSAELRLTSAYLEPNEEAQKALLPVGRDRGDGGTKAAPGRRHLVRSSSAEASRLSLLAVAVEEHRESKSRPTYCHVYKNSIFDNISAGVLVDRCAHALLEENEIYRNELYGIRGDVGYTLRSSVSMGAAAVGGGILDGQSRWTVADSPGYMCGTKVPASADGVTVLCAELRNNKVFNHKMADVFIVNLLNVNLRLVENEIYNALAGIYVGNNSHLPEVERNRIYDCVDGVYLESGGKGGFSGNVITRCLCVGVYVADLANPAVRQGNVIEQCGVAGIMVDAGGCGSFEGNTVRHCATGVICFAGPASPFHIPYDELVRAGLVSASPLFEDNLIEKNESHGVLVLSVINGCTLRTTLAHQKEIVNQLGGSVSAASAEDLHYEVRPCEWRDCGSASVEKQRLSPLFKKNTIKQNRMCGVFMDRFEHWNFAGEANKGSLSNSTTSRPLKGAGHGLLSKDYQQHRSVVKNAYGGYEALLGTSMIDNDACHLHQRELRQVSFVENTITECSIGFSASYGCHPFLLRSKVSHNTFFGLLLRFGSAVMAHGCEVSHNGIAGIYASSGAKGYLTRNKIANNNGFSRRAAGLGDSPSRDFNAAPFAETYFTTKDIFEEAAEPGGDTAKGMSSMSSIENVIPALRAYEQLTCLKEVHAYTMTDALCVLAQLVSASSAGIVLASGTCPTALFMSTSTERCRNRGGVAVEDLVRVCSADGGIGVWIEEDSCTAIHESTISGHTHMGVLLSTGVLQHHSVLHRHYDIESVPMQATKRNIWDEVAKAEKPAYASGKSGVLFSADPICVTRARSAAAGRERSADLNGNVSLTGLGNESLTMELGMTTTTATATALNADGSSGAASRGRPSAALRADEDRDKRTDFIHHALVAGNTISNNQHGVCIELSQALRAVEGETPISLLPQPPTNTIPTQRTRCLSSTPQTTVDMPNFRRASILAFNVSPLPEHGNSTTSNTNNNASLLVQAKDSAFEVTDLDVAVMDFGAERLDFTIVVERNTITGNRETGVLCIHNVEVRCGDNVASRRALDDLVKTQYGDLGNDVLLGKMCDITPPFAFSVTPIKRKTRHARILSNEIFANSQWQGEVTARYIAATADNDRTLLQFDTFAPPQSSPYASRALLAVPIFATLLQSASPGLFLWEQNIVRDSKSGLRVSGYVGSCSVRFAANQVSRVSGDALLVAGHMASATIGAGNCFEQNGVSIHVSADVPQHCSSNSRRVSTVGGAASSTSNPNLSGSATAADKEVALLSDFCTRIFQNSFINATESAVLMDNNDGGHVLVHRNVFSRFVAGAAALMVSDNESCALINGNIFRDSYVPVVVGEFGDRNLSKTQNASTTTSGLNRQERSITQQRGSAAGLSAPTVFSENVFQGNYIGALICKGAAPLFVRNLFEANTRAGLELVDLRTRPLIQKCVFTGHLRDVAAKNLEASASALSTASLRPLTGKFSSKAAASITRAQQPTATGIAHVYPADDGRLCFKQEPFAIKLTPSNQRVVGPDDTKALSAGVLLGPNAEATIDQCLFRDNDVGVDVARVGLSSPSPPRALSLKPALSPNSSPTNVSLAGPSMKTGVPGTSLITNSLFEAHHVCGVLVRSPDTNERSPVKTAVLSLPDASNTALEGEEQPPSVTLFDRCYFGNNKCDTTAGDVIAMSSGVAHFRKSVFYGTVHGREGGKSVVEECFFPAMPSSSSPNSDATASTSMATSAPAVMLHSGAQLRFERNIVYGRKRGLQAQPGAAGFVFSNQIICCTVGIWVAPFNASVFRNNNVWYSSDCGVYAYGGRFIENEVYGAPTGVIVQKASTYSGINAISAGARNAPTLALLRNTIAACSADGLLVASPGDFDSNSVTYCKHGINVVCPELTAEGLTPPRIYKSNVYDNTIGVLLDEGSHCMLTDCDIFDNDEIGLMMTVSASGVVKGNRISCNRDTGAVEMPSDSRVTMQSNMIRNQFSPAFNRGTRVSRVKDHDAQREKVDEEMDNLKRLVSGLDDNTLALTNAFKALYQDLRSISIKRAAKITNDDGAKANALSGAASRALRRASNGIGAHGLAESMPEIRSIDAIVDDVTTAKAIESHSRGDAKRAARRRSTSHIPSGNDPSSSSTLAKAARRNVRSRSTPTAAPARPVLIHVFTGPDTGTSTGTAIAQSVVCLLAESPMNRLHLTAHITTSASQLQSFLEGAGAATAGGPAIAIVVVDPSQPHEFGFVERQALASLHNVLSDASSRATAAKKHDVAAMHLSFTVLPNTYRITTTTTDGGSTTLLPSIAKDGMSIDDFASVHHTLWYAERIDDAFDALGSAMAKGIEKRAMAPPQASERASESFEQGDFLTNLPLPLDVTCSEADTLPTSATSSPILLSTAPRAHRTRAQGMIEEANAEQKRLSREHISQLLGSLSPDAFIDRRGSTPKQTNGTRKFSSPTGGGGEKSRRTSRNFSIPRKSSASTSGQLSSATADSTAPPGKKVGKKKKIKKKIRVTDITSNTSPNTSKQSLQ